MANLPAAEQLLRSAEQSLRVAEQLAKVTLRRRSRCSRDNHRPDPKQASATRLAELAAETASRLGGGASAAMTTATPAGLAVSLTAARPAAEGWSG